MILVSILLKTALWAVFFFLGSRSWLRRLLDLPRRPQAVGFIAWILAGITVSFVALLWIWRDVVAMSIRR